MTRALSICTARLLLRDFVADDLGDVHAFRSDPEVARFMDFRPESVDETRTWLTEAIFHNAQQPRHAYNLAIMHQDERRVIGWIGIGHSERYSSPKELGFGYALHHGYWGQGYATEAADAIVDFGFDTLGGTRISAWCWQENWASARVLEKAGLRFERHFEQVEPKSGKILPCREYATRREEWIAQRKA